MNVTDAINELLLDKYVTFPEPSQYNNLQLKFMARYNFPGVIGAVDGTHIAIEAPSKYDKNYPEPYYVYRKQYHSINTQLVSDLFYLSVSISNLTNPQFKVT